jgi:hypothetical protein
MLPEYAALKKSYREMKNKQGAEREEAQQALREALVVGKIDVNIMTKLDKINYDKQGNALPQEFADAHASLRGYANSRLASSIIFSAGMNPRLYAYTEYLAILSQDDEPL